MKEATIEISTTDYRWLALFLAEVAEKVSDHPAAFLTISVGREIKVPEPLESKQLKCLEEPNAFIYKQFTPNFKPCINCQRYDDCKLYLEGKQ